MALGAGSLAAVYTAFPAAQPPFRHDSYRIVLCEPTDFLGWVFYRFMRRGLWSIGLLAVFFYLLGTFSILTLAVLYLPMLIIFGMIMFLSLLLPKDVYIVYRI